MVVAVTRAKMDTSTPNGSKTQANIRLARRRDLTLEQHRIATYLIGKLDFQEYRHIPQREIARVLHIGQPNVSRAMQALVDAGLISAGPMIGPSKSYRLEASFVA